MYKKFSPLLIKVAMADVHTLKSTVCFAGLVEVTPGSRAVRVLKLLLLPVWEQSRVCVANMQSPLLQDKTRQQQKKVGVFLRK